MDSFFVSILQTPVVSILLVLKMTLTIMLGNIGHQAAGILLALTTSKML